MQELRKDMIRAHFSAIPLIRTRKAKCIDMNVECPSSPQPMTKNFFYVHHITEQYSLELHSPDRLHSLMIKCPSEADITGWYNALHSTLDRLMQSALQHANKMLGDVLDKATIHHIGWLKLKVDQVRAVIIIRPSENMFLLMMLLQLNWFVCCRRLQSQSGFHLIVGVSIAYRVFLLKNFILMDNSSVFFFYQIGQVKMSIVKLQTTNYKSILLIIELMTFTIYM